VSIDLSRRNRMAAKTRNRPPKKRSIQQPKTPPAVRSPWLGAGAAIGLAALAAVVVLTVFSGGKSSEKFSTGLPRTPDYHSLLVDPTDPQTLVLRTHTGLYLSKDGGRHWRLSGLPGDDAINLARPAGRTVCLAGHNVFEKSVDGGTTWAAVRPSGLPSLDIHGFAVDPRSPRTLYAAVAGQGLYRSTDGARSFSLLSNEVGGAVMALAVMRDGRILAGDMQQGLL